MLKATFPMIFMAILIFSRPVSAQAPLPCDIRVDFGSFTSTIHAPSYEKIMDKVLVTPSVTEKHIENLGPNGERTLCLKMENEASIAPLYKNLKSLVPAKSKSGWVRVTTRQGDEFMTRQISSWLKEDLEAPATDRAFD